MTADFLPSQVHVDSGAPLVGTMGRMEREIAASWLVLACLFHGDRWQPITPRMIIEAEGNDRRLKRMMKNPFVRPDFWDLVAHGFAAQDQAGEAWTQSNAEGPAPAPIVLTEKGFEAMRKWVRK